MDAARALSEQDVEAARIELSGGQAVAVWFTPAAVGVPAGGSAKIVSVGDVAEGDFIQVRPTGSRDTMFCSPGELTRTRPPRRTGARAGPTEAVAEAPTPAARSTAWPEPEPRPSRRRTAALGRAAATANAPQPVAPAAEVTVTLSATGDGEWTVEVTVGRKRTVRPTPVQPGDVAVAARALPPAVAEAISSSLDAARRRRADQVERLRAELEAAEQALKELDG